MVEVEMKIKINTKQLALAAILGAATWAIKTVFPGVPLDFAIQGAKIDFGWAPAVLAAVLIGINGGLVTGFCISLVPTVPSLFLVGLLWTPWTLAATGYLAVNRGWGWKASLVFPLLHIPIGVVVNELIFPAAVVWLVAVPAILVTEYAGSIVAAVLARYIQRGKILERIGLWDKN